MLPRNVVLASSLLARGALRPSRSLRPTLAFVRYTQTNTHSTPHHDPKGTPPKVDFKSLSPEKQKEYLLEVEKKHFPNYHATPVTPQEIELMKKAPPTLLVESPIPPYDWIRYKFILKAPQTNTHSFLLHGDAILDTGAPGGGLIFPADDARLHGLIGNWTDLGDGKEVFSEHVQVEINGRIYDTNLQKDSKLNKDPSALIVSEYCLIGGDIQDHMALLFVGDELFPPDLHHLSAELTQKAGKFVDLLGSPHTAAAQQFFDDLKGTSLNP